VLDHNSFADLCRLISGPPKMLRAETSDSQK